MNEKKIAHLGFIESTIVRMATNSSTIKSWSIGILAVIIGLSIAISGETNEITRYVLFFSSTILIVIIAFLDAFYLFQEKLYRCLFDLVRNKKEEEIDFSMDARYKVLKEKMEKVSTYWDAIMNKTIVFFYIPQMLIIFIFFILPMLIK